MTLHRPPHYAEQQANTRANQEAKEAEQLTLRDRFAIAVLMGIQAQQSFDPGLATPQQRAIRAYLEADAALEARKAPKEK